MLTFIKFSYLCWNSLHFRLSADICKYFTLLCWYSFKISNTCAGFQNKLRLLYLFLNIFTLLCWCSPHCNIFIIISHIRASVRKISYTAVVIFINMSHVCEWYSIRELVTHLCWYPDTFLMPVFKNI